MNSGIKNSEQFELQRAVKTPKTACFAPFIAMNFAQNGCISACCFNRTMAMGIYPQQSVTEAWNSSAAYELRAAMRQFDYQKGCTLCKKMIDEGNYSASLILQYDYYATQLPGSKKGFSLWPGNRKISVNLPQKQMMPRVFEFELSNQCNLECIMCGGEWSSAIQKNREGLPAQKNVYDAAFVEQITPFIPGLIRANFLGGEPFLISIYYDIWEKIAAIHPDLQISITSNGTVLNKRAKNLLLAMKNVRVTLSIDSLQKETWELIRRNGQFEVLQENIEWLLDSNKLKSFSVCPMIQNWQEIPAIVQFCEAKGLDIFFNTVLEPLGGRKAAIHGGLHETRPGLLPEVSLKQLPAEELAYVIKFYELHVFQGYYGKIFGELITQLKSWLKEKEAVC